MSSSYLVYIYKGTNIRRVLHPSSSISALPEHPFLRDVSVAQLVASMSGVVLGGVGSWVRILLEAYLCVCVCVCVCIDQICK